MKRSFELGMTLDYVSDWTVSDAVREFFQNSIDESIKNPEHSWFWKYDAEKQQLIIGNKGTQLTTKSLLMGSSTKKNDDETVGEHGEGYKVSTIVLLRTGHTLKIYNNVISEKWEALTVNSRRYGVEICKFDVSNLRSKDEEFGSSEYRDSLVFVIGNITEEEFATIQENTLQIKENVLFYEGAFGKVLLNSEERGRVYVNGLYVKSFDNVSYGYDFKPGVMKLDRDRHALDSFDVDWSASKLVSTMMPFQINEIKGAPELRFLSRFLPNASNVHEVYDDSYRKFKESFGEDTIPVVSDMEFESYVQHGYKCKLLTENDYILVSRATTFYKPCLLKEDSVESILTKLENWGKSVKFKLSDSDWDTFSSLVAELKGRAVVE